MDKRCDIGGDYTYDANDRLVYQEPCTSPMTHRYRSPGDDSWSYHCTEHATWLAPEIAVERL